ncbi:MAG: SPOR domain-containing protein [Gemmatimonadaceae bacterium]
MATRAVATGIGRAQALHRRVFVGDLLGDEDSRNGEDGLGISDMIRYGISLGRAARPATDSPNYFTLDGGAESPLAVDVLSSTRWRSLSDQVHRAGGLLLLAAPSQVPHLNDLLGQLDGVLLVGEAAPVTPSRVLGEVRTAATMRTPSIPTRAVPAPGPSRTAWRWVALAAVVVGLFAIPQVRGPVLRTLGLQNPVAPSPNVDGSVEPSLNALPAIEPRVTSDAAWSTELRFLNSRVDAQTLVAALVDAYPAATFAEVNTAIDSTPWYRVLLGAFSDSVAAEDFLAMLRSRGTVPVGAGRVAHTPFALLVDSASDNVMARLRVSGYQGRGLPAYALRDSLDVWHIYVGAFTRSADASGLKTQLDSLTIQSALVVRAGSTP